MDDQQLFKLGFLTRCAEAGMTATQAEAMAAAMLTRLDTPAEPAATTSPTRLDTATEHTKQASMAEAMTLLRQLGWLGPGLAALGGVGVGAAGAYLTRPYAGDPELEKQRELMAMYRHGAGLLRQGKRPADKPTPAPRIASI